MWLTQAADDVKVRIFVKFIPVLKGHEDKWVEWTDEQKAEYYASKK